MSISGLHLARVFSGASAPTAPPPSPLCQRPGASPRTTALVQLLERAEATLGAFLDRLAERLARFAATVFVTTARDLRPFHVRALMVERLPALAEIANDRARGPWAAYAERRRKLLLAKWQPGWQLSYGLGWADYLARIRAIAADDREIGRCL